MAICWYKLANTASCCAVCREERQGAVSGEQHCSLPFCSPHADVTLLYSMLRKTTAATTASALRTEGDSQLSSDCGGVSPVPASECSDTS